MAILYHLSHVVYLENPTVTIENVKLSIKGLVGIEISNSSVKLRNVSFVVDEGIGIIFLTDENDKSYLNVRNISIKDVDYKKVEAKKALMSFESNEIFVSQSTIFIGRELSINRVRKGIILNNKLSYIYNSKFIENKLSIMILSGF